MLNRVTIVELRDTIADLIAENEKSYNVPDVCSVLGLEHGTNEEAFSSKRSYVRSRIIKKNMIELAELGERLLERYPQAHTLENMLRLIGSSEASVQTQIKNLIFAADGPKPELILTDALDNTIEIVENASHCLVYDRPIHQSGLLWLDLVRWWASKRNLPFPDKKTETDLFLRLRKAIDSNSPPELLLFNTYFKHFHKILGDCLPALVPQVYLHFDPKTVRQLKGRKRILRQRMDFLILFSNSRRIVIEVDGKQHCAINDTASPQKYSEMVAEDRKLKLQGYEVYHFGGYELNEINGEELIISFFEQLFAKHQVHKCCASRA